MDVGPQGFPRQINILSQQANIITVTPPATTTRGALSIGDGPFDGISTGKFVGSTGGTLIAGNAASGFVGKVIDLQRAGNSGTPTLFSVDYGGVTTIYGELMTSWTGSAYAVLIDFSGNINTTGTLSIGSANFTVDAVGNAKSLGTKNQFTAFVDAIADYGVVNIGHGPFNGTSGGKFVGSASGNYIAINSESGFAGNLIDAQVFGVRRLSLNSSGQLSLVRPAVASGTSALLMLGSGGFAGGGNPNFVGSANGTIIGINATSFTGDFLNCTLDGISYFNVGYDGRITSQINSQWSVNQNAFLAGNSDFFRIDNAGQNGALNGGLGNQQAFVSINPNIAQTSTAGYTALEVNVTESATGSGTNLLLDLQVGGVSLFSVSNTGALVTSGTLPAASLSGTVPAASLANAKSRIPAFIPTFGTRNGPNADGVLLGSFPLTAVGSCRRALTGGTAFTDLTAAANNVTTADVTFTFAATNDALYIGHATLKFSAIRIKYTTASVYTATLVWEYWNGASWGTLLTTTPTFLTDATATFPASNSMKAAAGTYFIIFQPPSDWASTTVNAVAGFYVRLRVSAFTSLTTALAADQIWLHTVTSGVGVIAGQRGNITRIDFNAGTNSTAVTDSKFLIMNGTTGVMYLFTATQATTHVSDTTINLAVAETDQILIRQIQNNVAAFATAGTEFTNANFTLTITPA